MANILAQFAEVGGVLFHPLLLFWKLPPGQGKEIEEGREYW